MTTVDLTRPSLALPLDAVLAHRARTTGDELALVYAREPFIGERRSWSALDRQASRASRGLRDAGVEPGDRVAVSLQDSPECLAVVFAVWRSRATLVPLDPRWGPQTLDTILAHADVACVVGPDRTSMQHAGVHWHGRPCLAFGELTAMSPARRGLTRGDIDDVAVIAFTSGTTSNPKGVVIRHRHLRHAYAIARNHLFGAPPARFGSVFRLGSLGVLGLNFLFALECRSSTVVLPELTLENAAGFWDDVRQASVDFVYLVPALVQLVTRLSRRVDQPGIVECVTGAAPISEELHRAFQERFGHPLRNIYGISEASFGIFYGAYDRAGRGAWHLGRAAAPIRARLRNPAGEIVQGDGEGELEVTGPVLSDGYWRNPAATHEAFVDGWLRTGDVARRDRDGHYAIVGRAKDVVIRGGFNIHLEEVDHTLAAHPAVLGACTVGSARESMEEELIAVVQVGHRATVRPADLSEWCRCRLGASKTPGTVYLVDRPLPRNASGKIVRRQVLEMVRELQG